MASKDEQKHLQFKSTQRDSMNMRRKYLYGHAEYRFNALSDELTSWQLSRCSG
jgi:hypothetical protein